jgi:hypothetical protein
MCIGLCQKQLQASAIINIDQFCKQDSTRANSRAGCHRGGSALSNSLRQTPEALTKPGAVFRTFCRVSDGAAVALESMRSLCVADMSPAYPVERRSSDRRDRRKYSRSGRRADDPHTSWRRVYWLFGAYALYLSVRKLPSTFRRLWRRETVTQ